MFHNPLSPSPDLPKNPICGPAGQWTISSCHTPLAHARLLLQSVPVSDNVRQKPCSNGLSSQSCHLCTCILRGCIACRAIRARCHCHRKISHLAGIDRLGRCPCGCLSAVDTTATRIETRGPCVQLRATRFSKSIDTALQVHRHTVADHSCQGHR